jgi:hypothetical protein
VAFLTRLEAGVGILGRFGGVFDFWDALGFDFWKFDGVLGPVHSESMHMVTHRPSPLPTSDAESNLQPPIEAGMCLCK